MPPTYLSATWSIGTNLLVSVSTNGGFGNGNSGSAVMTPDGRYVAFVSSASNLVAGDLNGIPDIFVRDMQLGTTTLASPGAMSLGITAGSASAAAGHHAGRPVCGFLQHGHQCRPGGLVSRRTPSATSTFAIWWQEPPLGPAVALVPNCKPSFGTVDHGVCFSPKISADGSLVAYEVSATDLWRKRLTVSFCAVQSRLAASDGCG